MRPIQPSSKLHLLDRHGRRPRRGLAVLVAVALAGVTAVNVKVIADRYGADGPPAPAGAAEADDGATDPDPAPEPDPAPGGDAAPDEEPAPAPEASAEALAPPTPVEDAPAPAPDAVDRELAAGDGDAVPEPAPPADVGLEPTPGETEAFRTVLGRIQRNATVAQALADAGLSPDQTHQIVSALKGVFDFRKARPGDGFRVKTTPRGELLFFEYEASPAVMYAVRPGEDGLEGYKREIPLEMQVAVVRGSLDSSLYGSVAAAGEQPALAMLLADVLAWDIDFYRDPQRGDRYQIVVEKYLHKGRLLRYGEVLAAEYEGQVGKYQVFRFELPDGQVAYYDAAGQSAQKTLLKTPLKVARITSSYGMRRHPTLGYSKMHQGVDYGAPTGTPVWSVGDGKVLWAGWKGANGKLVSVRHANGIVSHYAHLSRILVRAGQRVRQKEVVGLVGSTGRSTGPHLHYGLMRDGRHINPLALRVPPREPVPASLLEDYRAHIAPYLAAFDGKAESLAAVLPEGATPN